MALHVKKYAFPTVCPSSVALTVVAVRAAVARMAFCVLQLEPARRHACLTAVESPADRMVVVGSVVFAPRIPLARPAYVLAT